MGGMKGLGACVSQFEAPLSEMVAKLETGAATTCAWHRAGLCDHRVARIGNWLVDETALSFLIAH